MRIGTGAPRAVVGLLATLLIVTCYDTDRAADPAAPVERYAANGSRDVACSAEGTPLVFASFAQSRELLRHPDDWARQLSIFDMGARRRTLSPTSLQAFLEFAARAAREWTSAERVAWRPIANQLRSATKGLDLRLRPVRVVKTTGDEEFGSSGYTREHAIMLTQNAAGLPATDRRRAFFLLAHELFHVVSRENPAYRDALYSLLGFDRFGAFEYPAELEERRLSNPDAFSYEHALTVQTPLSNADVVPVNQSAVPLEEAIELPSIFAVLEIVLLSVDKVTGEVLRDGSGNLIAFNFGNTDWVPRMQRNSGFIIHPEEILADNFATLMEWRSTGILPDANPGGFPTNDVDLLTAMEDVLMNGGRACPWER